MTPEEARAKCRKLIQKLVNAGMLGLSPATRSGMLDELGQAYAELDHELCHGAPLPKAWQPEAVQALRDKLDTYNDLTRFTCPECGASGDDALWARDEPDTDTPDCPAGCMQCAWTGTCKELVPKE